MTLDEITRCIDRQSCQFIVPIIASDDRLQPGCVGRGRLHGIFEVMEGKCQGPSKRLVIYPAHIQCQK